MRTYNARSVSWKLQAEENFQKNDKAEELPIYHSDEWLVQSMENNYVKFLYPPCFHIGLFLISPFLNGILRLPVWWFGISGSNMLMDSVQLSK